MGKIRRTLANDDYGHPCITQYRESGRGAKVFYYAPWHRKFKGLSPLQGLARDVIIDVLTDPSLGTIAQVFDSLQPSPRVDEFKVHLLRELRWAQRLLNDAIKHLDPKSKTPESEPKE